MPLGSNIKRLDFYRRVPVDLTEPTAPGAIISLVAITIMLSLFLGEIYSYAWPPQRTDMFVAQDTEGTRLKVNFNMTYHRLPCFATSVDVLDALGRHEMGMANTVHKTRVSKQGVFLASFPEGSQPEHENDNQREEGCNVAGYVMVNKVPGNFHISAHGLQHLVMRHLNGQINVMHSIHHLWIGEVDFSGNHGYDGELHPVNGLAQLDDAPQHYEYHLDIVPTIFHETASKKGKDERAYQLAVSKHKQAIPPGHMPAAFFRYQLSPITVRFGRERTSFIHFLTYVCAIVGGVFTVAGILNSMFHRAAVQFQRQMMGKQS